MLVDYIASVDCIGMLYVRLLSYTVLWCIGVMFVSTLWVCCMTWYVVWNHCSDPPVLQQSQLQNAFNSSAVYSYDTVLQFQYYVVLVVEYLSVSKCSGIISLVH